MLGNKLILGEKKATFLEERFGKKGFSYMGDADADMPVWQRAANAITVNAPAALRQKAERACETVEHLGGEHKSVKPYIKALRPHQWLKNVLVFLPMLTAHQLDGPTFLSSLLAFPLRANKRETFDWLKFTLEGEGDRTHGNAFTDTAFARCWV